MGAMYRIRYASSPWVTWDGELATDDFEEARAAFLEACGCYDAVDFQMRVAGIEGPAGEGGDEC